MSANHLFCEHGINAKACLRCFHKPKPKVEVKPAAGPVSPMQARVNAVVASTGHAPAPAPLPQNMLPGAATSVPQVQAVPLPHVARPKVRKSLDDAPEGPSRASNVPPTAYSYDSGTAPIPSGDQLWEPPARVGREAKGVIDQLPRHPNPNGK